MEIFINQDVEFSFNLVSSDRLSLNILLRKGNFKESTWTIIGGENCYEMNNNAITMLFY